MGNTQHKVFLIGGPPGAGKTTLATALAEKLDIIPLSMDDLVIAARAVTTPETHPGIHSMLNPDYFENNSIDQIKSNVIRQHNETRPIFERVVRRHLNRGPSIVMDGWFFRPSWIAPMNSDNIYSAWIVPSESVLEERERKMMIEECKKKNVKWLGDPPDDREQHIQNFLARSYWHNNLIKEEAAQLQMNILYQDGNRSVDELCEMVLETV